ncbi:G-D-S-L family lipolytic protein [Flavobacterium aestuarii]|uniref:G-D-S-L family lipolytic protein n=1 Tax=Flavobacterium aestuarii TaxID=3149227 RepID=UPI0032B3672E
MINNFKWLLLVSLSFVACNNNDDDSAPAEVPVTSGSASFAKYVALGDSFAAGYSDGALFKAGQETSYVNILGQQFMAAGGVAVTTPYMADNLGGLLLGGNVIIADTRKVILGFNADKTPKIASMPGTPTTDVANHLTGSFSNLGIPGAKSYHLLAPGYGAVAGIALGKSNPYYARFATSANTTVLTDALMQSPTFFSLFIGGNDVLGFATSGGVGINQTGNMDPSSYGSNDITDPNVFANVYDVLVTKLTEKGAKGAVANLPYITNLPFFTTVPFNPLSAKTLGKGNVEAGNAAIADLNAKLYGPLKQVLTGFNAGDRINLLAVTATTPGAVDVPNPLLISDEKLPNLSAQLTAAFTPMLGAAKAAVYGQVFGQARQATKADLILLTSKDAIAGPTGYPEPLDKFGVTFPFLDKHVLIASEVEEVKVATDAYNQTISSIAVAKGLAFVDTKSALAQLTSTTGVRFGNYQMTASYVAGGAFSLDGVHPTPRGYAYISNLFINAINAKYGSTLRTVDLAQYQTLFPAAIK